MSRLEALPVELFWEVTSYLHFLDKKALSIASTRCNAMTGKVKSPNVLTWFIHLCRSPARFHDLLLARKTELFGALIFRLHRYLTRRRARLELINADIEMLLSPYFPNRPFAESTLLHLYLSEARDFARRAIQTAGPADLDPAPMTPGFFWHMIEKDATFLIGWLEATEPTEIRASSLGGLRELI